MNGHSAGPERRALSGSAPPASRAPEDRFKPLRGNDLQDPPLSAGASADPAGLTARARPEARPRTRAANLHERTRLAGCGRALHQVAEFAYAQAPGRRRRIVGGAHPGQRPDPSKRRLTCWMDRRLGRHGRRKRHPRDNLCALAAAAAALTSRLDYRWGVAGASGQRQDRQDMSGWPSNQLSNNRHRQRWTPADTDRHLSPGEARRSAGSPHRDLASGRTRLGFRTKRPIPRVPVTGSAVSAPRTTRSRATDPR